MMGKELLKIAYTSERTQYNKTGIQRGLRPDRLREIGRFLSQRDTAQSLLPNAIIVSLSSDSYFKDGMLHIADKKSGEAFVIDGQHRLWAFLPEYSGEFDLALVVTVFIDLDDSSKATIFRSINGNQRKIDPSLVYDLIPMLRDKEAIRFEDLRCQELVNFLNESELSPWKDRIGMVGASERIISQSSFITALKRLFKKGHSFRQLEDFFEERLQRELILEYFTAIQQTFPSEWDNKNYLLCKYVGVAALLLLMESIIRDLINRNVKLSGPVGLMIDRKMFAPYLVRIDGSFFNSSLQKSRGFSYVGEGGITELSKSLHSIVFV